MKKYNLKPGKHQFAPGSHPVHDNDGISDAEVEWYMKRYPHISTLFEEDLSFTELEPETVCEMDEFFSSEPFDENITFLNH